MAIIGRHEVLTPNLHANSNKTAPSVLLAFTDLSCNDPSAKGSSVTTTWPPVFFPPFFIFFSPVYSPFYGGSFCTCKPLTKRYTRYRRSVPTDLRGSSNAWKFIDRFHRTRNGSAPSRYPIKIWLTGCFSVPSLSLILFYVSFR